MQTPPGGTQMPQLALQQDSPRGQTVLPQRSPWGGSPQYSAVQLPPIGAHIEQLALQQYSP
jgi:hypothetical protein